MSHGDGPRRLTLSHDRKIGGVCGGIADYLEIDPTVVRLAFVVSIFFPFMPVLGAVFLYFALLLIMPSAPEGAESARRTSGAGGSGIGGGVLFGGVLLLVGFVVLFQRAFHVFWPGWWTLQVGVFLWPAVLILIGTLIMAMALRGRG